MTSIPAGLTRALDTALDRSVVLGYTRVGSAVRRRFWAADPPAGALLGKHVVVTGATSGIGEAMALSFARLGATVHVLGRTQHKIDTVLADVRSRVPGASVVGELCDVSDLDAVRAWCADLVGRVDALHGLVHNAGVLPPERQESAQGHEMTLAAHVLGPHLMTELLLEPLHAGGRDGGATVVWMSSGGMYTSGLRADDLQFVRGEYDGVRAYARTKRMQVVLADAWAERLRESGVTAASMHPGWAGTPGITDSLPGFGKVVGPLLRSAEDGADTAVWLVATRPSAPGTHHFWHDRRTRPTTYPVQMADDRGRVADFLGQVADLTGTEAWPATVLR
ncbi:Fatty acyl-CoA reductase [Nocardioides aquaticus]|uniref:Fatty acyl-CoA reductase n=1 Tax=Nocardioides aquaticus TaxID=160826 RepID=A0ABX8EBW0_9ACTN|nr:SDR family NAD(P)-dependent oxidoreductase [Nocardioides aquaticus]QVT77704.1 Fatty acyl-CoA reductase [Nocardioides aquaticus]